MVETKGKIDVRHAQKAAYKAPDPVPPTEPKVPKFDAEKAEHDAIEKAMTINQRLAKEGSTNRVDVEMRAGVPHYRWGNFVPTRELTKDELDAVETLK